MFGGGFAVVFNLRSKHLEVDFAKSESIFGLKKAKEVGKDFF